jgi:type I restriction enzyme S subunit
MRADGAFKALSTRAVNQVLLKKERVEKLKLPLPSIQEQLAVTEILSTVDEAVQKTSEVVAKTERLKKGLMQELLTRGIGHKEFKDTEIGKIPKEWEVAKLEDVADTSSGGTPSRTKKEYFGGTIPWVKSGELKDTTILGTEEKITEKGLRNSSAKLFPKGTLLIALYGATVGKTAILGIDATTNQAVCAVIPKKDDALPLYIKHYIIFRRSQLIGTSSGGAQPNISQEIIRALRMALPPLSEQQQIVEILSAMEDNLERAGSEVEKIMRIKQGLMDLLLTGKIRVIVN